MEVGLKTRLAVLHFWCGLLSVAVVVMAAFQLTARIRTAEEKVSTEKPGSAVSPTALSHAAPLESSRLSYIQLISHHELINSWKEDTELSHDVKCKQCSLFLKNNSIHCKRAGLYQVYAQVTFDRKTDKTLCPKLTLMKNAAKGTDSRSLLEASFCRCEETVFMSKLVSLEENDTISIQIIGDYSNQFTFWGMIQFQ